MTAAVRVVRSLADRPDAPSAARAALRTAIEVQGTADTTLARSEQALKRGEELVRGAEAMVEGFADVEVRITAHRAQSMVAWATNSPHPNKASVPQDMLDDRQRRVEAGERLAATKFARETLIRERNAAQRVATAAKASVLQAVAEVVREEGEQIADRMRAAEEEALKLRRELAGLSRIWASGASGRPGPIELSSRLITTLNTPPLNAAPPDGPIFTDPYAASGERWRSHYKALQANPDATL